jgi:hypothetical protein
MMAIIVSIGLSLKKERRGGDFQRQSEKRQAFFRRWTRNLRDSKYRFSSAAISVAAGEIAFIAPLDALNSRGVKPPVFETGAFPS